MTEPWIVADGMMPDTRQLLILAALVIAIFIVMRMSLRRLAHGSPKQYRREVDTANKQTAAIQRDLEQLLLELEELSRRINAGIDTRFAKLEQSVADADKRISALRILLDAARAAGASLGSENEAQSAEPSSADGRAEPSPQKADAHPRKAEVHGDAAAAGRAGIATNQPAQTQAERTKRIYSLADDGLSANQIARRLHEPIGEVELILNLRAATGGGGWPGATNES